MKELLLKLKEYVTKHHKGSTDLPGIYLITEDMRREGVIKPSDETALDDFVNVSKISTCEQPVKSTKELISKIDNHLTIVDLPADKRMVMLLEKFKGYGIDYANANPDGTIPTVYDLSDKLEDTGKITGLDEVTLDLFFEKSCQFDDTYLYANSDDFISAIDAAIKHVGLKGEEAVYIKTQPETSKVSTPKGGEGDTGDPLNV